MPRRGDVPPDPDRASPTWPTTSPTRSPGRDACVQRTRRREVPPEPGRARRRLQGRADRRGLRRDPGRLPPLPPGHVAAQYGRARTRTTSEHLLASCRASNPVSRGLLLPERRGAARTSVRAPGVRAPSRLEASTVANRCSRAASRPTSPPRFAGRDAYRSLLNRRPGRAGQLAGREPVQPVALPVVQGDAAELRPDAPGRPDGDGALGRGTRAVPGSPRRRGGRDCRCRRRSGG